MLPSSLPAHVYKCQEQEWIDLTFPRLLETQVSPLSWGWKGKPHPALPGFLQSCGHWGIFQHDYIYWAVEFRLKTSNSCLQDHIFQEAKELALNKAQLPLKNLHHAQLSRLWGLPLEAMLGNSTITVLVLGHKRDPIIHTAQYKPQS